jgi:hypothetical protein
MLGNDNTPQYDIVDSLNKLYRIFQDDYVQNPHSGHVSIVSRSHVCNNHTPNAKLITLPELYLENDTDEIKEIRSFVTLLPPNARFYIIHYPKFYDIFSITWQDASNGSTGSVKSARFDASTMTQ